MKKTNVKINIIYKMLYEVLALSLPLVTSPYISRIFGAENLGIYSYTYSIATYFGMVAILGVKNYGNREIAKNRNSQEKINQTFSNIYALQLLVSLLIFIIYLIYVTTCSHEYKIYFLIQAIYVISCLLDINWFFFGMEQFKLTVARSTVIKLTSFIAVFALIHNASDLWKYSLIMSGSALISQIILWINIKKYAKIIKPDLRNVFQHFKPMMILFIPVVAVSLYNVMDKIMVGSLSTKTQLGFYENSEKIINCVKKVITSFGTVMMPKMSRLVAENNTKQSSRYMELSIDAVMCIAFALAFGIACVSKMFTPIYWGNEFVPCSILLNGLAVSIPFSALANVIRTQYLIPNSMDKAYTAAVVTGAIINIVVNFLLIPSMGAMGAVIGTIFAEGLVCIIQCFFIYKKINLKRYLFKSFPFLIFGLVMYFIVIFFNKYMSITIMDLLIEIFIGAVVYFILSLIYFIWTKNELVKRRRILSVWNKYKSTIYKLRTWLL